MLQRDPNYICVLSKSATLMVIKFVVIITITIDTSRNAAATATTTYGSIA
jgi:hypothetical protein